MDVKMIVKTHWVLTNAHVNWETLWLLMESHVSVSVTALPPVLLFVRRYSI